MKRTRGNARLNRGYFAEPVQPVKEEAPAVRPSAAARPDRRGRASLPFWASAPAKKQLRLMAAELDTHAARAHDRGPQPVIRQAPASRRSRSREEYHHTTTSPGDMVISSRPSRYSAAACRFGWIATRPRPSPPCPTTAQSARPLGALARCRRLSAPVCPLRHQDTPNPVTRPRTVPPLRTGSIFTPKSARPADFEFGGPNDLLQQVRYPAAASPEVRQAAPASPPRRSPPARRA